MSSQLGSSLTPPPRSPQLPVLRRSPRKLRGPAPTLPKTNAYIFTHGLYRRTLLSTDPPSVQYGCMQLSCNYIVTIAGTRLASTGNLIKHYLFRHKGIPTSEAEARKMESQSQTEVEKPEFFRKYSVGLTIDHFRKLLLHVIVSNNLPLRLVESPSFRALIEALNPYVFQI